MPTCASSAARLMQRAGKGRQCETAVTTSQTAAATAKPVMTGERGSVRSATAAPAATEAAAQTAQRTGFLRPSWAAPASAAAMSVIGAKKLLKYGAPTVSVRPAKTSYPSG